MIVNKAKIFNIPGRIDERAFEAIFVEYYTKVRAILYRITGDSFEADDLANETFWRLWEHPPARNDNLGGWIYQVALRMGYNLLRSNRRRQYYEDQAEHAMFLSQPSQDPASAAELANERERVHKILKLMPERDAQLLILRHSGLSYKEIAAALSIAPTSIGTLLARAEERFEAFYQKGEQDAASDR